MSQGGATRSLSATTLGNNDARVSEDSPIMQSFKRGRIQLEPPSTTETPVIQLNDNNFESTSTETVIGRFGASDFDSNNTYTGSNQARYLVSKLDRLHDKKERYQSHRQFLKKCLDNDIIPNGLRLELEPSIGNHDEDFLKNWYSKLEEYSKNFMKDVLAFCEKTNEETDANITEVNTELQTAVEKEQYDNVQETVIKNNTLRSHELQRRKNKKFSALKYKKESPRQNTPQHHWTNDQQRDDNRNDGQRHQHHQTPSAPQRSGQPTKQNHQERNYASSVSNGYQQRQQDEPRRTRSRQNLSRRGSFNNIEDKKAPLHQQISLQRKIYFRREDNEQHLQSEITKLQSQLSNIRNNNHAEASGTRGNTSANRNFRNFENSNRAEEHQAEFRNNNTNGTVPETRGNFLISNNPNNQNETHTPNQKNEQIAQNLDMGASKEVIQEAFTFVTTAMETLRNFETKFATLLNTHGTPSDRS